MQMARMANGTLVLELDQPRVAESVWNAPIEEYRPRGRRIFEVRLDRTREH